MRRLWSCVFFVMLCVWRPAVEALPLAHYPHATQISNASLQTDDYLLTLGALKKINGQWRSERDQRLTGDLERVTLELSGGHSVKEVFEYYRQQLLQMSARELFLCGGRRCGSSNSWANNRFHIKQLYGLDQHQYYSALALELDEGKQAYVALYGVLRGNQRSYIQIDVVTSIEQLNLYSSSEVIRERLGQGQSFLIPHLVEQQVPPEQLKAIVEALTRQPSWSVAVVGADTKPGKLEVQRARSLESAEAVRQQLIDAGLSAQRFKVFGLGGILPELTPSQRPDGVYLSVVAL